MESVASSKRGWVIGLVLATVAVFVGLVWLISSKVPWRIFNLPFSAQTATSAPAVRNCTRPVAYWQQHAELYPARIVLGEEVYPADQIKAILSSDSPDLTAQVKMQLVGVYLNISAGADQSDIESTLFQAFGWLKNNATVAQLNDSERATGTNIFHILEAFNLGYSGVGACPAETLASATASSTGTATATYPLTSTPSPSASASPTVTPSPGSTRVSPSQTVSPTPGGPGIPTASPYRSPTWTVTKSPPPPNTPTVTRTSAPPDTAAPTQTLAPPPTRTPAPPTATFTQPPLPTATYTEPPPPK